MEQQRFAYYADCLAAMETELQQQNGLMLAAGTLGRNWLLEPTDFSWPMRPLSSLAVQE